MESLVHHSFLGCAGGSETSSCLVVWACWQKPLLSASVVSHTEHPCNAIACQFGPHTGRDITAEPLFVGERRSQEMGQEFRSR